MKLVRAIPSASLNAPILVVRRVKMMLDHIVSDLDTPYTRIDAICIDSNDIFEKNGQATVIT